MPTSACFTQYFPAPLNQLGSSFGIIKLSIPHAGLVLLENNGRPFVPLYGLQSSVIDGNTVYTPLTVANNQTVNALAVYLELAYEAYRASVNYAQDNLAGSQILEPPYRDYLYKKLFDKPDFLARYNGIYNLVYNFWANANPAWTSDVYQEQLQNLINNILTNADKNLYIPNSTYNFDPASALATNYAAWKVTAPGLSALYGLELYI